MSKENGNNKLIKMLIALPKQNFCLSIIINDGPTKMLMFSFLKKYSN